MLAEPRIYKVFTISVSTLPFYPISTGVKYLITHTTK